MYDERSPVPGLNPRCHHEAIDTHHIWGCSDWLMTIRAHLVIGGKSDCVASRIFLVSEHLGTGHLFVLTVSSFLQ